MWISIFERKVLLFCAKYVKLYIYIYTPLSLKDTKSFIFYLFLNSLHQGKFSLTAQRQMKELCFVCLFFAAAAVSYKYFRKPYTHRLLDNSSINTGKLQAIILTLRHAYHSQGKSFLIRSNSLSFPQAIFDMKCDHLILAKNRELHLELTNSWYYCMTNVPHDRRNMFKLFMLLLASKSPFSRGVKTACVKKIKKLMATNRKVACTH